MSVVMTIVTIGVLSTGQISERTEEIYPFMDKAQCETIKNRIERDPAIINGLAGAGFEMIAITCDKKKTPRAAKILNTSKAPAVDI